MLRTVTHVSQLLKNKLEFGVHQPAGADRLSEEPLGFETHTHTHLLGT